MPETVHVSSISIFGARLKRGGGEWTRLKKGDEAAEHWTRLRKCAGCRVEEDGVNEDKVKLWTRLRRSSAGDEEDVEDKSAAGRAHTIANAKRSAWSACSKACGCSSGESKCSWAIMPDVWTQSMRLGDSTRFRPSVAPAALNAAFESSSPYYARHLFDNQ